MIETDTLRAVAHPIDPQAAGPSVSLRGTVGGAVRSDRFTFETAPDSNVVVRVKNGSPPRVEVGVYYV